jgi:DNA uptake protein ComE-like DNA-binding protein
MRRLIRAMLCGSIVLASVAPAAAERPTDPAQLLLWLLSMGASGERTPVTKIDINSASVDRLTAVPGVDRRQALQIIGHRPYAKLEELVRAGVEPRVIERLARFLSVESQATRRASAVPAGTASEAARASTGP